MSATTPLTGAESNPIRADLLRTVEMQREAFMRDGSPDLATRIDRLDRCIALITDNQNALCSAADEDFGTRPHTLTRSADFFTVVAQVRYIKKHLARWMKPEKRRPDFPFNLTGAKAYLYYQPLGVVGILTPWNVPVGLPLVGATDAISAGNRVVLKASENSPRTSDLMQTLVAKYFSPEEFTVVTGGPDVAAAFSSLPFDHLMYTGGTVVAKHVMRAAAANLVPVTLELGGKSPVFVTEDADMDLVAQKAVGGRTVNGGQACIGPDYLLLPRSRIDELVTAAEKAIGDMYPTIVNNDEYCSIINERHYERVKSYVDEARDAGCRIIEINPANETLPDPDARKLAPTLIIDPPENLRISNEEVFGPVMAVFGYDSIDDAIATVNSKPRPLVTYFFGKDKSAKEKVLSQVTTGGTTVNDVYMGSACTDLPFGGVGNSGMGRHMGGDSGFKSFSNEKAVFEQGWARQLGAAFSPPYGDFIKKFLDKQIGVVKDG